MVAVLLRVSRIVALGLLLLVGSATAFSAPSRMVPVQWVIAERDPAATMTFFIGTPDPAAFVPCSVPRLVIAGSPKVMELRSPGLLDRLSCDWPRARDTYAPFTWLPERAWYAAKSWVRHPAYDEH